jgi:hypothetical protein
MFYCSIGEMATMSNTNHICVQPSSGYVEKSTPPSDIVTDGVEHERVSVKDIFWPVELLMKTSGIYTTFALRKHTHRSRRERIRNYECQEGTDETRQPNPLASRVHAVYCGLCCLLLLANAARFMTVFRSHSGLSGGLVSSMAWAVIYVSTGLLSLVLLCTTVKTFPAFLDEFCKYQQRFGVAINTSRWRIRIRIVSMIVIVVAILTGTFFSLFLCVHDLPNFSTLQTSIAPWQDEPENIKIPVSVAFGVVKTLQFVIILSTTLLYYMVVRCLWTEYGRVADELEDLLEDNPATLCDDLETLRQQHEHVTQLVTAGNAFLCHYVAFVYCYTIPVICLMLYGVIMGQLPQEDVFAISYMIVEVVYQLTFVTATGVHLNQLVCTCYNSPDSG